MTQYFSEVLHQPTSALEVPDLQAIAKDYNVNATLIMCRLTIAIAVQCENNKEIIERIQRLTESEQHSLMRVIEQVRPGHYGTGLLDLNMRTSIGHVESEEFCRRRDGSQHHRVRFHDFIDFGLL